MTLNRKKKQLADKRDTNTTTLKLDSEIVFIKLRQKAMPRRSCKIQIHLCESKQNYADLFSKKQKLSV